MRSTTVVATVFAVTPAAMGRADGSVAVRACPHDSVSLGRLAFIRERKLVLFDLDSCTERVLARNVGTPVQVAWSADGNWLAVGNRLISAYVASPRRQIRPRPTQPVRGPHPYKLRRAPARPLLVGRRLPVGRVPHGLRPRLGRSLPLPQPARPLAPLVDKLTGKQLPAASATARRIERTLRGVRRTQLPPRRWTRVTVSVVGGEK